MRLVVNLELRVQITDISAFIISFYPHIIGSFELLRFGAAVEHEIGMEDYTVIVRLSYVM